MTLFTYRTSAESDSDNSNLLQLLTAINGAKSSLRMDDCRCWHVKGRVGYLYTWGDGKTWLLVAFPGSTRKWHNLKAREFSIPGAVVTQDGEDEAVIRLTQLPQTEEHKRIVRKAIGLRLRTKPNSGCFVAAE